MKELLAVILVASVVAEAPAPYAPSGWRPSGPSFELPQRQPQPQQYLPPFDPRNPAIPVIPNNEYGVPDDVSVQGLPTQEQQPIFQTSPINGPENQGPQFNKDIRNLDQSLNQNQYQIQQQNYQNFQRQRQLEASQPKNTGSLPAPQAPRQFASRTTAKPSTTPQPAERTTEASATQVTEANLNEREILEDDSSSAKLQKTSVEVSKQNLQQYPAELYLSSLAQLQLQPQFVPLQQLRDSYLQPLQAQGFDGPAHFAALPSVLSQQQAGEQQRLQNPPLLIGEQAPNPSFYVQPPVAQYQPVAYQPQPQFQAAQPQPQPSFLQPNPDAVSIQQPLPQYQPAAAYQPPAITQFQAQPVLVQPQQVNQQTEFVQQPTQFAQQPTEERDEKENREELENQQPQAYQPQFAYQQPQLAYQQPQQVYQQPQQVYQQPQQVYQQPQQVYQQPLLIQQSQPADQYQSPQLVQAQLISQDQFYQGQYQPQILSPVPQQPQSPDALQSGLDINQDGNDIEQKDEEDSEEDEGSRATAVATVFGARTQPRVFTQYGAPVPVPRQQASPGYATTTESPVEEVTEDGQPIAQAVAISGGRKKSAKLRNRRIRPLFTLDKSGHLVLAQAQ